MYNISRLSAQDRSDRIVVPDKRDAKLRAQGHVVMLTHLRSTWAVFTHCWVSRQHARYWTSVSSAARLIYLKSTIPISMLKNGPKTAPFFIAITLSNLEISTNFHNFWHIYTVEKMHLGNVVRPRIV